MIPNDAVEAAARAIYLTRINNIVVPRSKEEYLAVAERDARAALEAAAPILLSHEREQIRIAHVDAYVNRDTADALQAAIDAVCDVLSDATAFGRQATHDEILAAIRGKLDAD